MLMLIIQVGLFAELMGATTAAASARQQPSADAGASNNDKNSMVVLFDENTNDADDDGGGDDDDGAEGVPSATAEDGRKRMERVTTYLAALKVRYLLRYYYCGCFVVLNVLLLTVL